MMHWITSFQNVSPNKEVGTLDIKYKIIFCDGLNYADVLDNRLTIMRNGTSASKAIVSFTPQSATAKETHKGASGPVNKNGAASCAHLISFVAAFQPNIRNMGTAVSPESGA